MNIVHDATCAVIDTAQLAHNISTLKAVAKRPILAAIKANGYGHDILLAAKAFLHGGADYLGVARLSEALVLRKHGINSPILIIGGILPHEFAVAAEARVDFCVGQAEHIPALHDVAQSAHPVRVHLKVDTGMGRMGCLPENALSLAQEIAKIPGVEFTGLTTHFASADVLGVPDTDWQIALFDAVIGQLAGVGIRPRIIHAANSAGTLYHAKSHYDMVRAGISAYGMPADRGLELPHGVAPALTWKTALVVVKTVPAGWGLSYGSEYRAPFERKIGVIPVGYGDGFRRMLNVNHVLVGGHNRPILGRVCMDHCIVDLEGLDDVGLGDEVILIGKQGNSVLTAEDLAAAWNTIPYDVFTGIAVRVPRLTVT